MITLDRHTPLTDVGHLYLLNFGVYVSGGVGGWGGGGGWWTAEEILSRNHLAAILIIR